MANLDYIIDEVEKLKENEKKLESLEKYLDPKKSKKNQPATKYIESHPDYWKKQNIDYGVIETDEGKKWGSLNEEGKFIFQEDEVDDNESTVDLNNISTIDEVDDSDSTVAKVIEDNKIEIDGGNALTEIVSNDLKKDEVKKKKKFSLSNFTEVVGDAFQNIATDLPGKMKEVWDDKDRKRMFLMGLHIINESSGIKPLGQAKSPLGMISSGVLKAEKGFIAEDIAWYKAQNPEKRFETQKKLSLGKLYNTYAADYEKGKTDMAVDTRFNAVYKLAQGGKEPPVGILESAFSGFEKVLDEVGLLEAANKLIDRNQDTKEFSDKDLIEFKEIVTAATFSQVVGKAKLLYPVSNKDLELLKKTIGDVSTSPQAFRALVAAQKALSEIGKLAHGKSFDIAFEGEGQVNFRELSQEAAANELAETMKAKVNPETYMKLFGIKEPTTPFQIINAFYYQQLEPVYREQEKGNYFDVFKKKEIKDTENILELIENRGTGNTSSTITTN